MMKKVALWMMGITAMLSSCSQNEIVPESDSRSDVTVITASVDNGMKTRAVTADADDEVTRCLVQVFDGESKIGTPVAGVRGTDGNYTFEVLGLDNAETTYTFLFWADGGDTYYEASDLKAVAVKETAKTNGIGIAYSYKVDATKAAIANTPSTLTHAVAKVTLMTTTALSEGKEVALTVPTYYTFNVATGTSSGTKADYVKRSTEAVSIPDGASSAHVFSVYVLGAKGVSDGTAKIVYGGQEAAAEQVSNLPLSPNKHITLSGDVSSISDEITFKATMNTGWSEQNQNFPETGVGQ